ncbi:MAG: tRNA uracil 4-sulfurtransferase ThiI [Lentisphaeria bacterium]
MPWQPFLPYNAILCRYNEIGTKGRNRGFFEERLCQMLQKRLASIGKFRIIYDSGRIFLLPMGEKTCLTKEDVALCRQMIPTIAGVSSISPGFYLEPTLDAVEGCVCRYFSEVCEAYIAANTPDQNGEYSYAMRARRSNKEFSMTSEELERYFAEKLLSDHPELSLDLRHAGMVVEVEIRRKRAFVSFERIAGPGGLPSGSGGCVLALLSGGFDSPVACYQMMRRGCSVDFLTFHSSPYTPPATVTKVCTIVRKLNQFQKPGKLLSINLLPAQKAVRDLCRSRFRTILYRRFMIRIANVVTQKLGCQAIVTGDNLGQVASQTMENMATISQAAEFMVLRPLLTFEKLETMELARKIDTFDISSEDVPDSCTVFAPARPSTMADPEAIYEDERGLDIPSLMTKCLKSAVLINATTGRERPMPELGS